jgi:hypothetical protein
MKNLAWALYLRAFAQVDLELVH